MTGAAFVKGAFVQREFRAIECAGDAGGAAALRGHELAVPSLRRELVVLGKRGRFAQQGDLDPPVAGEGGIIREERL